MRMCRVLKYEIEILKNHGLLDFLDFSKELLKNLESYSILIHEKQKQFEFSE
jgi:hypothetical protein